MFFMNSINRTTVDLALIKIFIESVGVPAPPMTCPKNRAAVEQEAWLQEAIVAVKDNQYACYAAVKVFDVLSWTLESMEARNHTIKLMNEAKTSRMTRKRN